MFFTKFPHRSNFVFAENCKAGEGLFSAGDRQFDFSVETYADGIYRVTIDHADWGENRSISDLTPPDTCECSSVGISKNFGLRFQNAAGKTFLETTEGKSFGVSGPAWLFQFSVTSETKFYGMGEKDFGRFELSGIRTKFWNTDVWGDFHFGQWKEHTVDPPYLSIPYVILKQGDEFVGILLHTPGTAFFETPGLDADRVFQAWQETSPQLLIGAECGKPDLWVIHGPSLKELTRKLQKLVGVTPVPPIWSLGYHQSRWGYAGHKDLMTLDHKFQEHQIPCDALWLDIDYMDGFRVFTVDKEHFPSGLRESADALSHTRRKVVAILDPGVKKEVGYNVYDDLKQKNLFCLNPENREFVGMVWPGETIFPDLTLAPAQDWWAGYVRQIAVDGLSGVWLDMNDPSTGPVDPTSMLFQNGRDAHALHRNQYALGMQMGTHKGFLEAFPNKRPFILSRSGSTGTSKYSAIWTGDNLSNYFYLKMSIPTSLNLSLSGVCFNGPDVGGFGGDTTEKLLTDWTKACCLFPFMRNHNSKESADQEPWAFSAQGMEITRKFIRLRYKLLPYLYNLFCDQEESGDPILRPLLYEFPNKRKSALDTMTDQFMVGPSILQAPILDPKRRDRKVVLPGKSPWLDARNGQWCEAGSIRVAPAEDETPLYVREGTVLPMRPGIATDTVLDLNRVDVFICASPTGSGESNYKYRSDDGESFDYQTGKRSEIEVSVTWTAGKLSIQTRTLSEGYGQVHLSLIVPVGFESVTLNGRQSVTAPTSLELSGKGFTCSKVQG
jgi:alpha-glucosidase